MLHLPFLFFFTTVGKHVERNELHKEWHLVDQHVWCLLRRRMNCQWWRRRLYWKCVAVKSSAGDTYPLLTGIHLQLDGWWCWSLKSKRIESKAFASVFKRQQWSVSLLYSSYTPLAAVLVLHTWLHVMLQLLFCLSGALSVLLLIWMHQNELPLVFLFFSLIQHLFLFHLLC